MQRSVPKKCNENSLSATKSVPRNSGRFGLPPVYFVANASAVGFWRAGVNENSRAATVLQGRGAPLGGSGHKVGR